MQGTLEQALEKENNQLKCENKILSLRVQVLEKELYGSRADRRKPEDPNQYTFSEIDKACEDVPGGPKEENSQPKRKKERKGKKKGPKPLNPNLPRIEEHVRAPDPKDLICPITGTLMQPLFSESIEVLARKPAEYYVRRITRQVYGTKTGDALVYSTWPKNVLPKSRIDASVVANILTARFADHQPYYRQSGQLARQGVSVAPNTMGSMVKLISEKLQPIYNAIKQQVLKSGYIMVDPTPIRMQSLLKKGSTTQATLWTYRALDGPVLFEFARTKSGNTPAATLKDYQGIFQTDGATNFGGVPSQPNVIHLNCWAHARRYFVKAEETGKSAAKFYLDRIDKLFRIERLVRHFRLRAENVLKLRQRHSLDLVDALFEKANRYTSEQQMLKMPLPKAVNYLLGRTKALRECFLHAPSRIDNNLAENALPPIKLGVKNWMFLGHENAGPRTATMYTLVENCRILGINPETYFIDVLARIDDHSNLQLDQLTPHYWGKAQNG